MTSFLNTHGPSPGEPFGPPEPGEPFPVPQPEEPPYPAPDPGVPYPLPDPGMPAARQKDRSRPAGRVRESSASDPGVIRRRQRDDVAVVVGSGSATRSAPGEPEEG